MQHIFERVRRGETTPQDVVDEFFSGDWVGGGVVTAMWPWSMAV